MEKNIKVVLSSDELGVDVEHNPLMLDAGMSDNIYSGQNKKTMENESDTPDDYLVDYMEVDEIKNSYLNLPRANSPEKIIICLDVSSEMEDSSFRLSDGTTRTFFSAVKQAAIMYLHTKHLMDSRHQFALVLLNNTAVWLGDFTNDPQNIISLIKEVKDTITCDSMQMSSLFNAVVERVRLPEVNYPEVMPPDYIIRAILLYGRSQCIPHFDFDQVAQKAVLDSKYFFLDTIYLHKRAVDGNKCELIFDSFRDLNSCNFWYVFEVDGGDVSRISNLMAKLLAHPLQRPIQKHCHYKLVPH